ncbi:hypothetical protein F4802DRAFT_249193 [Xylaria palmicola]|nr:hypothetical protein F4802DRAFT_249193 [Xylaria palmicola]
MTSQQDMSERHDRSSPMLEAREWSPLGHQHYPPPRDVRHYATRALPLLPTPEPTRPQSTASSIHYSEEGHSRQHTSHRILIGNQIGNEDRSTVFSTEIDEHASAMIRPQYITIPDKSKSYDPPPLVSPQPQRPDSKLLRLWANGDELVSPLDALETPNWMNYVVSPLSDEPERRTSSETGRASMEYESWFDDASSDEEEEAAASSYRAPKSIRLVDAFPDVPRTQLRKTNNRYSDPGSPPSPRLSHGFGESGPDTGGLDNVSGRQTVQPHISYSYNGQGRPSDRNTPVGKSNIPSAVSKFSTFPSNRPVPPPLQLTGQSIQDHQVKSPLLLRSNSVSSHRSLFRTDKSSARLQKRRSGLGGVNLPTRPSTQNSLRAPPPGFIEIISQLDYHGSVSSSPRIKGMLSKAKQGLGIGSEDLKREKRREESRHMI